MSDHVWAQENLSASIIGCLTPLEQELFDRHVIGCPECAQALADANMLEERMISLFAEARPADDLAQRAVERLPKSLLPRRWALSMPARVLVSAAAVVVVGLLGAAMHSLATGGELTFPGSMQPSTWSFGGDWQLAYRQLVKESDSIRMALNVKDDRVLPRERNYLSDLNKPWSESTSGMDVNQKLAKADRLMGEEKLDEAEALVKEVRRAEPENTDAFSKAFQINIKRNQEKFDKDIHTNEKIFLQELSTGFGSDADISSKSLFSLDGKDRLLKFRPPAGTLTPRRKMSVMNNFDQDKVPYFELHQEETKPSSNAPMVARLQVPSAVPEPTPNRTALSLQDSPEVPSQKPVATQFKPDDKKVEPAEAASRKIIRTGDMEFVVDSFDAAVSAVTKLINGLKGAFVATVNSDKLPNGKMRGSVVVRMPPQNLDAFILDLRRDLAKTGELKNQKIGSQDITKQYTDIESRLRAARGMEERLLNIIKNGKGEIKDLVAAEKELGIWRTKIEEMEGEIRYYGNQVALSTLTINFTEKEIQAPSALVVSERVGVRIETEEVEKGQQGVLAAVDEAKGRVVKSDLKQHAVGQLEAIVHAEIAPAHAAAFREALGKLGIVRNQDSQRTQQTEGGSGTPQALKPRFNDVVFEVTLYNTANIQPRETYNMLLTTLDVPSSYRKLHDAVLQARGQVRVGQLNEQDKRNTTAQLDFDVPANEKQKLDKVILEVGQIFSSSNNQVAVTEVATDRKVGYRVVLRNVAGIPPRETVVLSVEVNDVDKKAAELKDLVRASKGRVAGDDIDRQPNGQVTAQLVFDVPLKAQDALVRQFKDAGKSVSYKAKQNPQIPDNDLATANIVLTLTGTSSIVPDDQGLWNNIRTSLYMSFVVLSWSVMFIILGLCVVLPWALVIWVIVKVVRKMRGKTPGASVEA